MNETYVVTPNPGILSYPALFEPRAIGENPEKRFRATYIFEKSDTTTLEVIKNALNAAIEKGIATCWGGKKPGNLRLPLKDGDTPKADGSERGTEFKGCYFISPTAKEDARLDIVDGTKGNQTVLTPSTFYAGCFVRMGFNLAPYNHSGNNGVSAWLQTIQFVRDGEPLGNGASAASDFAAFTEDAPAGNDPLAAMLG